MKNSVIDFIQSEDMLTKGDNLAVALSGGADSMALLHMLMTLRASWSLNLSAIHIHHGLRQASDDEEVFVKTYCKENNIPLLTKQVDLTPMIGEGMSVEMAAREARYSVFGQYASDHNCLIALGHHMDDQAETVLLNLLRGTGVQGLKGMLPQRGCYIRPLLKVSKEELLAYCDRYNIPFVTDESNDSRVYRRNYLRHDVLPLLEKEVQPKIVAHLSKTAEILREEDAYMEALTVSFMAFVVQNKGSNVVIDLALLNKQPKVMKRRLCRKALGLCIEDLRNVNFSHIEQMIHLGDGNHTGKCCHLPDGWQFRSSYNEGFIELRPEALSDEASIEEVDISKLIEGHSLIRGAFEFKVIKGRKAADYPKEDYTKWFDYDKIGTNLVLRTRAPGDYITLGGEGFKKKLKDYLIDTKVPRFERGRIPLIALGQEVVWLVGYRINETYKVSETTTEILSVVYNKEALQ